MLKLIELYALDIFNLLYVNNVNVGIKKKSGTKIPDKIDLEM